MISAPFSTDVWLLFAFGIALCAEIANSRAMIILGIDPGSRITGYGLIKNEGNHSQHIENGSFYLAQDDLPFAERLASLFNEIQGLIKKFKPSVLVVENILLLLL